MKEIERLKEIKILLKTGQISYDKAKEMAKVPLSLINQKIKEISKKCDKNPSLITFGGFMR